jgi:hypothetical protein
MVWGKVCMNFAEMLSDPNKLQVIGETAPEARPEDLQEAPTATVAGPSRGEGADTSELPVQVEGLPIFTQHTRPEGGGPMGPGAGMFGPVAFGGIPGFPIAFGGDDGLSGLGGGLGTAVGGMVVELGISGEGTTPTSVRASGFGDVSGVLRTLFDPHASAPSTQDGPQTANTAPGDVEEATLASSPQQTLEQAPFEAPQASPTMTPQRDSSRGTAPLPAPNAANVQSPHDLQHAMATLAMRLSHDLDSHRSHELSDDERQTITERISLQYLQQVPDLMQVVAPRAGAHIQSLLVNLGHAPHSPSLSTDAPVERGARDGTERSVVSPVTLAQPSYPSATDLHLAAGATGATASKADAAEEHVVDAEMHASDEDFQDAQEAALEPNEEKSNAAASLPVAGIPDEVAPMPGPSGQQRPRPKSSPQGLGGGLKRRKNGRPDGGESRLAHASPSALQAPNRNAGASMGMGTTAANPLQGLMTAMTAGGLPGATPNPQSAAANPLQSLMAAMTAGGPPSAASGSQIAASAADGAPPVAGDGLASLMQSMMPMMNSMLGGGASGASGRSGTDSSRELVSSGSRTAGQPSKNGIDVLKAAFGARAGKEWAEKIKKDLKAQARMDKSMQHSAAYTAGASPMHSSGLL